MNKLSTCDKAVNDYDEDLKGVVVSRTIRHSWSRCFKRSATGNIRSFFLMRFPIS